MSALQMPPQDATIFDVRHHGARGDGRTLDTASINAAILAAARCGGGTVLIPAGRYLCFTLRLRSNVSITFAPGAVIEAADPALHPGRYDPPDGNSRVFYQDFGHSHWRNSLIWGDEVENVVLAGPGLIDGKGLTRNGPVARWRAETGERPLSMRGMSANELARLEPDIAAMDGLGNKAIALKAGRNITISGLTLQNCGHFAILATGARALTLRDLMIDTNRDGIDLDCVCDALVERCRVNTPNDDAIVVKSSYALGRAIAAENIVIRDCHVSGFDLGTMVDGTRGTTQQLAPDRDRVTGRIKLGTESNGGYRNILIEDCSFTRSRGLALETVDGGVMEGIIARRLTMREVTSAPLFLRLGNRARGPVGTGVGAMRDIRIESVTATGIDPRYAVTLAGLAGHPIEHVALHDIALTYRGGAAPADAVATPPELASAYPEPSMFGPTPAWGLWMRYARGVTLDDVRLATERGDPRPAIVADDVTALTVENTPTWHAKRLT
ncbi:MAG: exo-poly-alpha-D-galacturonosidase [Sphingomonas sp.]|nr:exo-poly-alpha-D-galacturonosidase [Sphingomonas sp.]